MKLNVALIVAAFAASASALPAPRLAVRSPEEQRTGVKDAKNVKAKCWSGCGGTPAVLGNGLTWSDPNLVYGQQTFQSFPQFQQGLQTFLTITTNTYDVWQNQNIQAQQFAIQFKTMLVNFYYMVNQFSGGCQQVCGSGVQPFQFQSILTQFFGKIQLILSFIQNRYPGQIGWFRDDFALLSSCIQVVIGIANTVGTSFNTILSGLDLNTFNQFQIPLASFQSYNTQSLFSSVTNVATYVQSQSVSGANFGGASW